MAKGLAALGYRVLTYDLYGRGYSDRPPGLQDRAFFLSQLEELLEDQEVEDDFTLLGYSMGGAIATAFASAHPGRVRGLILLASAGFGGSPGRLTRLIRQVPLLGNWLMLALYPSMHIRGTEAERDLPGSVPGIAGLQQRELAFRGFVPAVLSSLRGILNDNFDRRPPAAAPEGCSGTGDLGRAGRGYSAQLPRAPGRTRPLDPAGRHPRRRPWPALYPYGRSDGGPLPETTAAA